MKIYSNRGVSMIEGLVALGIIGVTVMGIVQLVTMSNSGTNSISAASCSDMARASLNLIESVAYRPSVYNYAVLSADAVGSPTATSTNGLTLLGISSNVRWPGLPPYKVLDNSNTPAYLRSANLINGSITLLQSLYNSDPNYCQSTNGVKQTGSLALAGTQTDVNGALTYLKIQPYQIDSNQVTATCLGSPAQPLLIRPAAQAATPPNLGSYFDFPPGSRDDLGFLATVYVSFTDNRGVAQSCSASEPFFYFRDSLPPIPPTVTQVSNNTPSATACVYSAPHVKMQISYPAPPAAQMEPGTVLACRDGSVVGPSNFNNGMTCLAGGVAVETTSFSSNWVPCDSVTACGVPPTSGTGSIDSNGNTSYTLVYDNLPWNCVGNIEVAAIDVAGNNTPSSTVTFQVTPPACNSYCSTTGQSQWCPPYVCPPPPPTPPPPAPTPSCSWQVVNWSPEITEWICGGSK